MISCRVVLSASEDASGFIGATLVVVVPPTSRRHICDIKSQQAPNRPDVETETIYMKIKFRTYLNRLRKERRLELNYEEFVEQTFRRHAT